MTKTAVQPKAAADNAISTFVSNVHRDSGKRSGAVVITAHGDLDAVRIPELRRHIATALGALNGGCVILDLREVDFLAISVARELVELKHRANRCGLDIRLVLRSIAVQRALDVTGAFLLFPAYSSMQAATEGVAPPH